MTAAFDNLKASVAAQNSIKGSIETLVQGMSGELKRLHDENEDLKRQLDDKEQGKNEQSLADQLSANTSQLADLVVQNTPVATVGGTASDTDPEGNKLSSDQKSPPETSNDGTSAKTVSAKPDAAEMDPSKAHPADDLNTAQIIAPGEALGGETPQDPTITKPAQNGSNAGMPS